MPDTLRFALRLLGFAVGLAIGWQTGSLLALLNGQSNTRNMVFSLTIAIGALGYVLGPHISRAIFANVRDAVRRATVVDLVAIALGLVFGGLIAALLAFPLAQLPAPLGPLLPMVTTLLAIPLAILVALLRKRDLVAPFLRARVADRPRAMAADTTTATATGRSAVLLDSSVIIDGRIAAVLRTGFLDARLLIPRFVLEEVQYIADQEDPQRRARGRRGLDTLTRLRQDLPGQVEVIDTDISAAAARDVDGKLVCLAKERGLRILTNDYNLNRVAQIQGVSVLNVNELAGALRPPVSPGDDLQLRLTQEGREAGQGVGFLDDGTMVVVDGGKSWVGRQADVTVVRLLPTGAGRMIFAVPKHASA